ncbi:Uncharacterized protein GBIM_01578, partial [Gryllus bimaculatus]
MTSHASPRLHQCFTTPRQTLPHLSTPRHDTQPTSTLATHSSRLVRHDSITTSDMRCAGCRSVRDRLTHPVHVYEGDDALVTCVVRDAGDNTVLWKKEDRERHSLRVLTAGEARVTADRRFDVLHDAGGDVWVLVIKETKAADAGIYVCEVNSNPVVRSFHKLSVLSRALQPPPENGTGGAGLLGAGASDAARSAAQRHNYTACCAARNVSAACFGFCAVQSILQGNTGQDPERCEKDFPDIVRCMA